MGEVASLIAGFLNPNPAQQTASLYATAEELAAVMTALIHSYEEHARKLREAKVACANLIAQMEARKSKFEFPSWSDDDRARYFRCGARKRPARPSMPR